MSNRSKIRNSRRWNSSRLRENKHVDRRLKQHWEVEILIPTRDVPKYTLDFWCRPRRLPGSFRTEYKRQRVAACQLTRWGKESKRSRNKITTPKNTTSDPRRVSCKNCKRTREFKNEQQSIWSEAIPYR